ncbi:hypothetical protein LPTSP4_00470 [Leptospira ryugenii]|uniref:AB hydrolase-1 domain-containing protein n=1 Tax=Leptospira ryugenii TaxID=1917863 RepID=A0A2P2DV75_9LEPT|nr:alpha/beta fold hydrolase [Leptospira ryugenii]GBF48548.1 hypothetical protein LPTSP4_00470 [Leptospira ryugenii]
MKLEERSRIQIPKGYQIALELAGFWDVCKLLWSAPSFAKHPKGKGEPTLVVPGYGTNDQIMFPLRQYLQFLGYQAEGWELGLNHGNVPLLLEALKGRITEFYEKYQTKINLVGWSLGGYLAREAARDLPHYVSKIATIASPLFGGAKYTSLANFYADKQGIQLDALELEIEARYQIPLEIPSLSIYSKFDNIVSWQTCIDTRSPYMQHKEVDSTHVGMIVNPEVYELLAHFFAK